MPQRPVPCGAGVLRHRLVSFERARGEDRELLMSVEGLCVRSLWEIASGDVVYPSTLAVAALGFSGLGGRNPFPLGLRGPGRLPVCLPSLCLGGTERARASPSGDRVPNRELGRIRYFPPSGAIPIQTAYTDARPGVQCARALGITRQGSGRVYVGLCCSRASCTLHTALGASFLGTRAVDWHCGLGAIGRPLCAVCRQTNLGLLLAFSARPRSDQDRAGNKQ